jgi:O-antigen ligase
MAIPVVVAYVLSQRRAAMVALAVGVILILAVLFQRRRRAFWFVAPSVVVLATGLILATWNASGALGLPASAAKTVLFPDEQAEADAGSDMYRQMESFNLQYTIRSYRLFGRGFGQEFLRPVTMPDISFFEFWKYIPHNNVLWLWVKLGFFGFAAVMYMFGRTIQLGARSLTLIRSSDHVAFAVVGVSYVAMFLVFSYVDIAYNARCTVFLGVCMALCADFVQAYDIDAAERRQPHFEMVPQ